MATRIIGLELTEKTQEKVEGHLKKIKIYRDWRGELKEEIINVLFLLNVKDKTFKIPIGHISDAIEIGKRLERKGYKDLTLIFNDQKIKISEM